MDERNVQDFLNYLVNKRHVSPSTQNQALSALLFLYRDVLQQSDFYVKNLNWSKKPKRIPVVLSRDETRQMLQFLDGKKALPVKLMYGAGLRVSEAIRLRVGDLDFDHAQILVRSGKGKKDRFTILPLSLRDQLKEQIHKVKTLHRRDLDTGAGNVSLPHALHKKYPNAVRDISWQYVFPSRIVGKDPRSGLKVRHHISRTCL